MRMKIIKQYTILLLGVAITAFGIYNIHSRFGITEGGILGGILLLENWFSISPGITNIILDGTCYALGFYFLGKQFLINALIATGSFSLFYCLFEDIGPVFWDISRQPLLVSLIGALFVGTGVGMVVRQGGAVGGDDALALVISKVFGIRLSFAYLGSDITVLLLSLSYIPPGRIIYSLITVTLSSFIIDRLRNADKKGREAGSDSG